LLRRRTLPGFTWLVPVAPISDSPPFSFKEPVQSLLVVAGAVLVSNQMALIAIGGLHDVVDAAVVLAVAPDAWDSQGHF
jgi:hypothetical protein